eukprot:51921_1
MSNMDSNCGNNAVRNEGELLCDAPPPPSPVLALWPRMSKPLRDALYGALCEHGIVSTRKAVAAIRGVDGNVRAFLSRLDGIAPGARTVPSTQDSEPRSAPVTLPRAVVGSPGVHAAARSFLGEGAEEGSV